MLNFFNTGPLLIVLTPEQQRCKSNILGLVDRRLSGPVAILFNAPPPQQLIGGGKTKIKYVNIIRPLQGQ